MKKPELKFGLTPTQWDKLCLRCGECCKIDDHYCPYLTFDEHHKATCTIYKKRLWTEVEKGVWCNPIATVWHRADKCPYNKYYGPTEVKKYEH
jgi:hypothetical protein